MKVTAIIPAAGSGKRAHGKKQFLEIDERSVLSITVSVFEDCQNIDEIIVVVPKDDEKLAAEQLASFKKVKSIIPGGEHRQDSVFCGLSEIRPESNDDIVVIHDAARPFVTKELISKAVNETKLNDAVIVGVPAKDTLKTVNKENIIEETLEREKIWLIQTPQVFKYSLIKQAYERASKIGYKATDDSKLVERMGVAVKVVLGSYDNFKLTTKEDIEIARTILKGRGM